MYIDLKEYRDFARSDYTGDDVMLNIPRQINSVNFNNGILNVSLKAIVCKKDSVVVSALMLARKFSFTGNYVDMNMRIELTAEDTVRLRLCDGKEILNKEQPMLLKEPKALNIASLTETDEQYELTTENIKIVLQKDPYRMEIFNKDGLLLYKQYNDDLHNVTNDRRRGFKEGDSSSEDALYEKLSFPSFEVFPFGKVYTNDGRHSSFTESVATSYDESYYGLGERFNRINKKGQELLNWTINPVGVSNNKAYKVVPFFISSKGYGVYYNTPRKIRFSMCDYYFKAYECQVEDDLLDMFIFVGNTKSILKSYGNLTGKSAMPPKWAFGAWMSRNCYMTQQEIEDVAQQLRDNKLPCDVMHVDWSYCKTPDYDYEFDKTRYPDVPAMAEKLLKQGIKLSAWHLPYVKFRTDTFAEIKNKGYLAHHEDGSIADSQAEEGVLDFSNEETVAWYKGKIRNLLNQGIRVLKTDFGENAQPTHIYKNCDGRDMHNLYPLYYNKIAYETCMEVHPEDSLVWGRSAYSGCQRYPLYWGGDSDSDYNGMYNSLRGGLSIGLSGFPFWSHDVGGYFCTPEPDVYIRWLQFGMLSPAVRFHGTSAREPWAYGDEAVNQYKKYAALRYSLMEYIYSEAIKCSDDCTPMMRALVIDFPSDKMTSDIDDEYMFGRNILVAPVFSNAPTRKVYLPAGNSWMDLHNGNWYDGGKCIEVATPIDITPVFLRGTSATPFIEPMNYVDENPITVITWEVCPNNNFAEYDLKTDKLDVSFRYDFCEKSGVAKITLTGKNIPTCKYNINCPDVKKVYVNGEECRLTIGRNNFVTV